MFSRVHFKFQTFLGNKFHITEGHKILCWIDGKEKWISVEKIDNKSQVVFPVPKIRSRSLPTKLVLSTVSRYVKEINFDKDFFRFLGFWIGDGFTNNYHRSERIGLIFNANKERKLCDHYKNIVKKIFNLKKISQTEKRGALIIYWRDKPFREWLTKHFRRECLGKMLPNWFNGISKENFNEFIKGWIESDGSRMIHGGYKIVTKEKDLAAFGQLLALSFKKLVGLRRIRSRIPSTNFEGTYYELIIPKTLKHAKFIGNKLVVKILHKTEIKDRNPRKVVYNFQVKDDESYVTSLVTLHNCQIHLDKSRKIELKDETNLNLFSSKKQYFVRNF